MGVRMLQEAVSSDRRLKRILEYEFRTQSREDMKG